MIHRILVWDIPTRWFHWLLAISFVGGWLTAESERMRDVHVMFGYTLLGLIVFRLVWGVVGSRYARFSEFVRAPALAIRYLKSLLDKRPEHYVGHNPVGAMAVVILLLLGLGVGFSGWMSLNELGGEWGEEAHELFSNAMLLMVLMHIAGVVMGSLAHKENLVSAMMTGYKYGKPEKGISDRRLIPAIFLVVAVSGFWWSWFADGTVAQLLNAGNPSSVQTQDNHGRHTDRHSEDRLSQNNKLPDRD